MKQAFECRSCSTLISLQSDEGGPLWCPICRGRMMEVKINIENPKKVKCPDCATVFSIPSDIEPYKCVSCNYTFISTPRKKYKERL